MRTFIRGTFLQRIALFPKWGLLPPTKHSKIKSSSGWGHPMLKDKARCSHGVSVGCCFLCDEWPAATLADESHPPQVPRVSWVSSC